MKSATSRLHNLKKLLVEIFEVLCFAMAASAVLLIETWGIIKIWGIVMGHMAP